tara:strand:- start:2301 stop:2588 length:288 start_codon:yes stop_codon:yes gene_type:complete
VTDQQIAVAMHSGAEFGLTAAASTASTAGCASRQLPTLGLCFCFDQRSVKALLEQSATGTDVTTTSRDVILRPIAERSGLVQQFFADQHFRNQFK